MFFLYKTVRCTLFYQVGDLDGRKKTLADKIFGNKENRPDNHLVLGYQVIITSIFVIIFVLLLLLLITISNYYNILFLFLLLLLLSLLIKL